MVSSDSSCFLDSIRVTYKLLVCVALSASITMPLTAVELKPISVDQDSSNPARRQRPVGEMNRWRPSICTPTLEKPKHEVWRMFAVFGDGDRRAYHHFEIPVSIDLSKAVTPIFQDPVRKNLGIISLSPHLFHFYRRSAWLAYPDRHSTVQSTR